MKKFTAILVNIIIFAIGMIAFNCNDFIRSFLSNNIFNASATTFACIITITLACIGIFGMITGIHGLIYQTTGFSLYAYASKKLGISEKTDN